MSRHIAESILAQLGGRHRIDAMIGVKKFLIGEDYLQINFKSKAKNKADRVQIQLEGNDTYTITAFAYNRRTLECPEVGKMTNIYVENLIQTVETMLELRLSF